MTDGPTRNSQNPEEFYSGREVTRSLKRFLVGKGASALVTFAVFALLARWLPRSEYAAYIAAIALIEIAFALSTLGLDWVVVTFVPRLRVVGDSQGVYRLMLVAGGVQAIALAVLATVLWAVSGGVVAFLGFGTREVFAAFALVLFIEGIGRLLRDQMLTVVLAQGRAQAAQVGRSLVMLLAICTASNMGSSPLSALTVAYCELIAAFTALIIGGLALGGYLLGDKPSHAPSAERPSNGSMVTLATHAYSSYLLSLAYGPQVITALVARFLGVDATALFGFARSLTDQVRRYLPSDVLIGILRPTFVARFALSGDFRELAAQCALLFKLSVIVVAGLLVVFVAFGAELISLIGGSGFAEADAVMLVLLIGLLPYSHRRVIEVVANASGCSALCVRGGLLLCVIPLASTATLAFGGNLVSVMLIVAAGEVVFSASVILGLRHAGCRYSLPWSDLAKVAAGTILLGGLGILAQRHLALNVELTILTSFILLAGFAILMVLMRPWTSHDLRVVQQLFFKPTPPAIP